MLGFRYDVGSEDDGSGWDDPDQLRIFELPELHPKAPVVQATDFADTSTAVLWENEFMALGDVTFGPCMALGDSGSAAASANETGCNFTDALLGSVLSNATSSYPLWQVVVLGMLAGCTSIITIVGNLIVILSFIIDRSIRQPTNYFIASLAVSDLLIGSISMPFYTIYLLADQTWMLGEILCDLWLSIDYTVCLSSIYTVFCITIDRFCSVIIPAKYRDWRTERRVLIMVGATWIVPALLFFISIFGWQYFVGARTIPKGLCYVQYLENPVFSCLLQIGYFWITLIVMCVLYTGIYRVALKLAQRSEQKHKKMTSLVSVAGRTVTRIGVGVTQKQNIMAAVDAEADKATHPTTADGCKGQQTHEGGGGGVTGGAVGLTPKSAANKITSKVDEGSSSTGYPSDTDPGSSQSAVSGNQRRNGETTKSNHRNESGDTAVVPKLQPPPSGRICKPKSPPTLQCNKKTGSEGPANRSSSQMSIHAEVEHHVADGSAVRSSDAKTETTIVTAAAASAATNKETDDPPASKGDTDDCVLSFPSPTSYRRKMDTNSTAVDELQIDGQVTTQDRKPLPAEDRELEETSKEPQEQQQHRHISLNYFRRVRRQGSRERGGSRKNKGKSPLNSRSRSTGRRSQRPTKPTAGRAASSGQPQASKSENRAKKALRTISVILGAFVLCWTPWHVLAMIVGFYEQENLSLLKLYDISYWLCYLNSPINPFCYALANQQFKKTFSRILRFDWHRT